MKFYTKEWYDLRQHLHYTCGVKKIPDKEYSDKEIRELYYLALKKEVGTIKDFKEGYRIGMRYVPLRYSAWVLQAVDKRLLALDLMPERVPAVKEGRAEEPEGISKNWEEGRRNIK